jgi:hypothetical protein
MKYFILAFLFFLSTDIFSQLNKEIIINNKFSELINLYEENQNLIEFEQLETIIRTLRYVFINNNEKIIITMENEMLKLNFHENEIKLNIISRFVPMHLTGSFTYCTGTLYINDLSFDFYLYEYNTYSWDYNAIKDNNNLAFCYFDTNDEYYAYFNRFRPYGYEIFTIEKYINNEDFLERSFYKIKTIIFYNGNNIE